MNGQRPVLAVAVAAPVMGSFDYLAPVGTTVPMPGQRIRVPFGRSRRVGIILELRDRSELPLDKLRPALEVLDSEALLPADLLRLLRFAARYYRHPIGEVFAAALPAGLRDGSPLASGLSVWRLTGAGAAAAADPAATRRAPVQAEILRQALAHQAGLGTSALQAISSDWRRAIRKMVERGWLAEAELPLLADATLPSALEAKPALNEAQQAAVNRIISSRGFTPLLLDGITGSGKTEVYLHGIQQMIDNGRQSLVLVPEIALTPQLVDRFRRRLGVPVVELHSGLADGERIRNWTAARNGSAAVVIGTRSAIFVPLARPGLLIVDEEHDASYKQQEGFRYSARDLAVWRASDLSVPVVLGSATPALESIENCHTGRYKRLLLPARAGGASVPEISLIDLRRQSAEAGLSQSLQQSMERHLTADGQVILYLNRRGYAPTLLCTGCGWVADCGRCDARMVLHQQRARLVCHHCGAERSAPQACPECTTAVKPLGQGTERLEEFLARRFAGWPAVRIDRDTTRRRGEMARRLDEVRSARARILLGTQMLTKGHDFPQVTLVGIIDADQGLFGTDFRSSERLAQVLIQVAGRAGRAERAGEVLVQTAFPEHPLLRTLLARGYAHFAELALLERKEAGWPPFACLCLLRAEASARAPVFSFLAAARAAASSLAGPDITLLGPAPAPMERRSGAYRGQLLVRSADRRLLQHFLDRWHVVLAEQLPERRKVRWTLDVDPLELF